MRYQDMRQLMGNISPDVIVEGAEDQAKALRKPIKARVDGWIVSDNSARVVLEERFLATWQHLGGPPLAREVRFHPERKWRFDFADNERKIAYEIQGGLYTAQSGHRSKEGVMRDQEKLNAATLLGWRVFHLNTATLKDADYMRQLIDFHLAQ